jgi:purine nucleoside phosphorylase
MRQNAPIYVRGHGTCSATQGPRFETAAEFCAWAQWADIVGMTGMPEAGLAREFELCYASISVVVNPAAGMSKETISLKEIEKNLETGMANVRTLLEQTIPLIVRA